MNNLLSIRIEGKIKLLSALSHIGESIGPDSYLSRSVIVGPDLRPNECFLYSGNSFRGILRDLSAKYLLDKLRLKSIPLDAFYLLFSGGSLGGKQSVDIDQARRYRKLIPAFSIFGGGVGNQIIEGKMSVGFLYPICRETEHIVPKKLKKENLPSWRQLSYEHYYTRRDDAKQERLRQYIECQNNDEQPKLIETEEKPREKESAQQMRFMVEMMAAGTEFWQRIDIRDCTEIELGAFVTALHEFQKHPHIGGKSSVGHGMVSIEYDYANLGETELQKFMTISEEFLEMSEFAKDKKEKYDQFLADLYIRYIEDNADDLKQLIGEAK